MKQIITLSRQTGNILILLALSSFSSFAQCPSGTLRVTGTGCGCISGCNLTSLGGPNCSPAVSGDCNAGQLPMSVNIDVPEGCTYTVSATMRNRLTACTASGGDGGDQVKVDVAGGSKSAQTGTGNATLNDSYTLVGPGIIVVSGSANRADEIITYTTTATGEACVNCMSVLPVELTDFRVSLEERAVACEWQTETELNNDFFTIERSLDGIHFEYLTTMQGAGTSFSPLSYKIYDYDPYLDVISYYRLSQTDFNGTTRFHDIRSVYPKSTHKLTVFPNPSTGTIRVSGDPGTLLNSKLYDTSGREIGLVHTSQNEISVSGLPAGVYTFVYFNKERLVSERIVVTP